MISVVYPTFNELRIGSLKENLKIFSELLSEDIEWIFVDSYSRDGTVEWIREIPGTKLLQVETTSRAKRLNIGASEAKGELLLLHHPRTAIPVEGWRYLIEHQRELTWGGFRHAFDVNHPLLRFTSWYSNSIRAGRKGIVYLDHCIFVQRQLFEKVGGIPEVDIFEDTQLSYKLREVDAPQILPFDVTTSAVRFVEKGIYRQAMTNQLFKIGHHLNLSHQFMNTLYEKGQNLNAHYRRKR